MFLAGGFRELPSCRGHVRYLRAVYTADPA